MRILLVLAICHIWFCANVNGVGAAQIRNQNRIDSASKLARFAEPSPANSGELVGRPELAVPLFALVRRFEPQVSLHDLDRSIATELVDGNPELEAVVSAGRKAGVALCSVVLDVKQLQDIPVPCLLLVSKSARRGRDGALVLVEAKAADQLQVYDFQGGKGRGFLHFSDLPIIWSGDAIVVVHRGQWAFGWWLAAAGLSLLMAAVCGPAVLRRIRPTSRGTTTAVFTGLVLLSSLCGCRPATLETPGVGAPVSPAGGTVFDLGTLKGDDADQCDFSIPLRVDHRAPVRIDRVLGNCTCLTLGEDVVGTLRLPGEEFNLTGRLRLDGKIGEDLLILQMRTSGSDGLDLPVSKFGLRFVVHPRPLVDIERLVLGRFEDEPGWRGRLSLFLHRRPENSPLAIDAERSDWGGLAMKCHSSQQGVAMEGSEVVRDVMDLEFTSENTDQDGLPKVVRLAAMEYEQAVELPVETVIRQPLVCEPASLFLGILPTGSEVEKTVRLEDRAKRGMDLNQIRLASGGAAAHLKSTVVDEAVATVKLVFRPTGVPGRNTGEVVLELANGSELKIPTSWVIR